MVGPPAAQLGDWTVTSRGATSNDFGLEVEQFLNPNLLVIDGGKVKCDDLGFDGVNTVAAPKWDFTIKNGATIEVGDEAWHNGPMVQVTDPTAPCEPSTLTYDGPGNRYTIAGTAGIHLNGELIAVAGINPTLDILMTGPAAVFRTAAELVRFVQVPCPNAGTLKTITFDADAVAVKFSDGGSFEPVGVDYDGHWLEDANGNPVRVYFTDSPSVVRWGKIIAEGNGANPGFCLFDGYESTPISGAANANTARPFRDAVYVKTLTIGPNVTLIVQGNSLYYTDGCTIHGVPCGANDAPIRVTQTIYGDFDGDQGTGDDQDDVAFFNDHFPTDLDADPPGCDPQTQGCYNALADFNADRVVDCVDRTQFVTNFPNAMNVENCP